MDGVPYMTQPPVEPGESFAYEFTPPDAGTFFFHPHCNTVEQLGRGLAGVLIVEDEAETDLFVADHVVAIKDWRLKPDGAFDVFSTDKGAARAGTFGNVETVNGQAARAARGAGQSAGSGCACSTSMCRASWCWRSTAPRAS